MRSIPHRAVAGIIVFAIGAVLLVVAFPVVDVSATVLVPGGLGKWASYPFELPSRGSYSVEFSSNGTIDLAIMTRAQFDSWYGGGLRNSIFAFGGGLGGRFSVDFPAEGVYVVLFSQVVSSNQTARQISFAVKGAGVREAFAVTGTCVAIVGGGLAVHDVWRKARARALPRPPGDRVWVQQWWSWFRIMGGINIAIVGLWLVLFGPPLLALLIGLPATAMGLYLWLSTVRAVRREKAWARKHPFERPRIRDNHLGRPPKTPLRP